MSTQGLGATQNHPRASATSAAPGAGKGGSHVTTPPDRFRLDVFVHRVWDLTVPAPVTPAIVLRLLNFPPLVIPRTRDDSAGGHGDGDAADGNALSFNRGKTCEFAAPAGALAAMAVQSLPMTVMLVARRGKGAGAGEGAERLIGTTAIDLSAVATQVGARASVARAGSGRD